MIPRFLPRVIEWINQHVKCRGDTDLRENDDFGFEHVHVESGLYVEQAGRDVWKTRV